MANTLNISKAQLTLAFCLPLAVLVGYFLAEPLESANLAVVLGVCGVLSVPLAMKWHHPMLVFSWNLMFNPFFLPGRPQLWTIMACMSLLFTLLNRAVQQNGEFNYVPSVAKPLLFLGLVVVVTATMTGGVGIPRWEPSGTGGKRYFYLMVAIIGYFALSAPRIPRDRAALYVFLFFSPACQRSLTTWR